jgi:hypothetical protein
VLGTDRTGRRRLEAAAMRFLSAGPGYRLTDLTQRNEDIREELKIVDINSRIKDYQINWLQRFGRMQQNGFPNLLADYKLKGRRDQGPLV